MTIIGSYSLFLYTIRGRLFINFCTERSVGVEEKLKEEAFQKKRWGVEGGRKRDRVIYRKRERKV